MYPGLNTYICLILMIGLCRKDYYSPHFSVYPLRLALPLWEIMTQPSPSDEELADFSW